MPLLTCCELGSDDRCPYTDSRACMIRFIQEIDELKRRKLDGIQTLKH